MCVLCVRACIRYSYSEEVSLHPTFSFICRISLNSLTQSAPAVNILLFTTVILARIQTHSHTYTYTHGRVYSHAHIYIHQHIYLAKSDTQPRRFICTAGGISRDDDEKWSVNWQNTHRHTCPDTSGIWYDTAYRMVSIITCCVCKMFPTKVRRVKDVRHKICVHVESKW